MRSLVLIAHNLRSIHNVGSLLRTAEGLGVDEVYLTGYTPYPSRPGDKRLPHLASKLDKQIAKTALGAERQLGVHAKIEEIILMLQEQGHKIAAVEQIENSVKLPDLKPPSKLALIVGREVEGIESEIIDLCDFALEIPMYGKKESFNVVQAAAMVLYHCRFAN
jgi:23S rRNA (guanosine2251-2'-O)-methyltransferase